MPSDVMKRDSCRPGAGALLGLLLAGTVAACGSKVPMPADSEPPQVVLETYVKALVAGDLTRWELKVVPAAEGRIP